MTDADENTTGMAGDTEAGGRTADEGTKSGKSGWKFIRMIGRGEMLFTLKCDKFFPHIIYGFFLIICTLKYFRCCCRYFRHSISAHIPLITGEQKHFLVVFKEPEFQITIRTIPIRDLRFTQNQIRIILSHTNITIVSVKFCYCNGKIITALIFFLKNKFSIRPGSSSRDRITFISIIRCI